MAKSNVQELLKRKKKFTNTSFLFNTSPIETTAPPPSQMMDSIDISKENLPNSQLESSLKDEWDSTSESHIKPESDLNTELHLKSESGSHSELNSNNESSPKNESGSKKEPNPLNESDLNFEARLKCEPDSKTEFNLKPESNSGLEPGTKTELDSEVESSLVIESSLRSEPSSILESHLNTESDSKEESSLRNESNSIFEAGLISEADSKMRLASKKNSIQDKTIQPKFNYRLLEKLSRDEQRMFFYIEDKLAYETNGSVVISKREFCDKSGINAGRFHQTKKSLIEKNLITCIEGLDKNNRMAITYRLK